ncbi:MAG TPA: DUF4118 domain-containing protein [Gemmatimonadales bacterium]|nr:DUF4118 domain-containing protein [Gemmatimonadales bacterium]
MRPGLGLTLAVLSTGAAVALTLALQPLLYPHVAPPFLLAIAVTAVLGGLAAGLTAVALSAIAVHYWFFPPAEAFGLESMADLVRQLVLVVSGLLIAVLAARARALQRAAEARAAEARFLLEGAEGRVTYAERLLEVAEGRASAAERRAVAAEADLAAATERTARGTILIVEPDVEARQLAARAAESAGYRWVSACDGVEALELLDRYDLPFALVLTELRLPDLDGADLMNRIAARRPGVPVLYTSIEPAADLAGRLDPDRPVLRKPFSPGELLEKMRETLHRVARP